ncbi:hypothetical protein [Pseudomonas chlororaphis]|uniref:hypothetical protein n=1 Tax=Pseudomonas chlororaphis TaxID=587753 RepID=UPI000A7060D3|nr:hypothetical protein [Pseudomonas chlororaphis]
MKGLLLLCLVLLSACNTKRMTDPAIVTEVKDGSFFTTIATTSDRRIFIVNSSTKRTCGEPPAGVAENISASLSNSLAVALKDAPSNPQASNKFAESAAKTVANVSQKTQGVMLYEAMASGFCMAYANDLAITPAQYMDAIVKAGSIAAPLIAQEIQLTRGNIGPDEKKLASVPASASSTATGDDKGGSATASAGAAIATTAQAAAIGSLETQKATGSADKAKVVGEVIKQVTPPNATIEQKAEIVGVATETAVSQTKASPEEAKKAGESANRAFIRSQSLDSSNDVARQVTESLKALKTLN